MMTPSATLRSETLLPGGTTNAGRVSRVGDTVRRPDRPTAVATRAVLEHLDRVGFDGAPRFLGIDERGREMLSWIPGAAPIAPTPAWALDDAALVSVARLLRRYHDAIAGFDPSGLRFGHQLPARFHGSIVSHNDPNLDNVIFHDGEAVSLIDFDLAAPGSRGWDLACAARLWVPLRAPRDVPAPLRDRILERFVGFVEAYRADRAVRAETIDALPECHRWCYAIVRAAVADSHAVFCDQWQHGGARRAERTGRWLARHQGTLRAALGV